MEPDSKSISCIKGLVSGRVQGVGFRYFVMCQARSAELSGYVRNLNDGKVEFLLQGSDEAVTAVIEQIHRGPEYSQVLDVKLNSEPLSEFPGRFPGEFQIR